MTFHVPNHYRHRTGEYGNDDTYGNNGAFSIPSRRLGGTSFKVIASDGKTDEDPDAPSYPWEHVSVSLPTRCPTWDEMCFIKGIFWDDEDAVMQLHPPRSDWVNNHQFCLHLWRPTDREIPMPPSLLVGFKEIGVLT